jgi:hypothetical protein
VGRVVLLLAAAALYLGELVVLNKAARESSDGGGRRSVPHWSPAGLDCWLPESGPWRADHTCARARASSTVSLCEDLTPTDHQIMRAHAQPGSQHAAQLTH